MATLTELKRYVEQTLLNTEARTALRKIVEELFGGGGGGGVPEAPVDGTPYARQDAGWVAANGKIDRTIGGTLKTGASAVLLPGESFTVVLTYDMTLDVTAPWYMRAPASCSAVVDVQRATVAAPTTFTSIAAAAKPTLSGAAAATGAMTGYATSLLAGEQIRFICESASGTDQVFVAITAEAA